MALKHNDVHSVKCMQSDLVPLGRSYFKLDIIRFVTLNKEERECITGHKKSNGHSKNTLMFASSLQ